MIESKRPNVLCIGELTEEQVEPFFQREMRIERVTLEGLNDMAIWKYARAIVLSGGKHRIVASYFDKYFSQSCDLGLLTAVLYARARDLAQVVTIRDAAYARLGINARPSVNDGSRDQSTNAQDQGTHWVYQSEHIWQIAEKIAGHNPGPISGSAIIECDDSKTPDPETTLLLRRAFWDCARLRVERISEGNASKGTYRVFATFGGPEAGPQPVPFFVKIGTPEAIAKEKFNYRVNAEPFIPFHLRPSLNDLRCVTTHVCAALVCDFIEGALPLRDALRNGHAGATIFALFEVTLRGLRSHTLRTQEQMDLIRTFVLERARSLEIVAIYQDRIESARRFGLNRNPPILEKELEALADKFPSRRGIYHGDLNAGNIMVRNRDAIVIDFESMADFGPLSADPAVLEVSLAFGTDAKDDPNAFESWRSFINYLFVDTDPLVPPIQTGNHFDFGWLEKAIRELRHVTACCGVSRKEALIVLCACLVSCAAHKPRKFKHDEHSKFQRLSEQRRAYALVIAEKVYEKYLIPLHE
jgi:hypothetical protein